jgi:hypothetical protein
MAGGRSQAGRSRLQALLKDANARGFKLIAWKAAAVLLGNERISSRF